MKRLMISTALATLLAMPVAAQDANQSGTSGGEMQVQIGDQEFSVSALADATIYMQEGGQAERLETMEISEPQEDWVEIGTIDDVILNADGSFAHLVMSPNDQVSTDRDRIGVQADSLAFIPGEGDQGQVFVVYTGDRVSLEQSEEYDEEQAMAEGQTSASEQMDEEQMAESGQQTGEGRDMQVTVGEQEYLVSSFMDATVYMQEGGQAEDLQSMEISEPQEDWVEIGTIDDVVINEDGSVAQVVLSPNDQVSTDRDRIGVQVDGFAFVRSQDDDRQVFVVYTGDRVSLEQSEEYDEEQAMAEGQTSASEQMDEEQMAESGEQTGENGEMLSDEELATLTADDLTGEPIHGPDGTQIGDISELILNDQGEIETVVIDVGGFLGIGEKPVALQFSDLEIRRGDGMFGSVEVSTQHTEQELNDMERWSG